MDAAGITTLATSMQFPATNGSDNSSDCRVFNADLIKTIIIAHSVECGVASVMCLVGIVVILATKQYRTFVHRLVLYMMVVGFFHGIATGLEVSAVHHDGKDVAVRGSLNWLCIVAGLAEQVTLSQLMLVLTWILVYLFLLVVVKYKAASRKHEIAGLVITLGLPLTFDWLPFIHNLYGLSGAWCWIRITGTDCHDLLTLGLIFQNVLFYGPKLLLVSLSFVMFLIILVTLCKGSCSPRSRERTRTTNQEAVQQALPLVLYPVLYNIIVGVMVANRIDYAVSVAHNKKPLYPLFLAHAIVDPLRIMFIPMAFLLHPGTVRKILGRDRPKRSEDSETNYPVPPEPSFSEVDPLVIRGSINRNTSQDYEAIFETSSSETITSP